MTRQRLPHALFGAVLSIVLCIRLANSQSPAPVVVESPLRPSIVLSVADDIELRWDFNEPVGFMALHDGDSACVTFPAVPGGRLDSLRIGLRRAGSISGIVWRHGSSGSPLRPPVLAQFLASSSNNPPLPYPVPWTNWAVVDLRGSSISTDTAFSVSIVNSGDPQLAQRVMVTIVTGSPVHSYTYLQKSDSVTANGWYVLPVSTSPDTTYAYLVRAYVATPTSADPIHLVASPAQFGLEQNYPNPFNPETVVSGQWPVASDVRLAVYDLLGREVAVLADGRYPAGKYSFRFDGSRYSSGVYIYRLTAGSYTDVRTMTLLK